MRKIIFIILILAVQFTYAQTKEGIGPIITPGVLKIESFYTDSIKLSNNMVFLLSLDKKVVDSLYIPHDDYSKFTKEIKSRAYYPKEPYGIIFFDSYPLENGYYKVYCNGSWYYINNVKDYTRYMSWDDFIMSVVSIEPLPSNFLREQPSLDSKKVIYNYSEVALVPKKIQGEWVYVDVYDIEQTNLFGNGWLRWRNKNELLVKLYFSV